MADDKDKDLSKEPEHHSKLKGAVIGGAAGGFLAGKKGAAAGAAIGAEKQHKKNEEGK
jgi:outer membrane lipoprotein SlyB